MTSIFLEKNADTIYEEFEEGYCDEPLDDEYREDKLEQMVSKYTY
jgi:hypothetical protein